MSRCHHSFSASNRDRTVSCLELIAYPYGTPSLGYRLVLSSQLLRRYVIRKSWKIEIDCSKRLQIKGPSGTYVKLRCMREGNVCSVLNSSTEKAASCPHFQLFSKSSTLSYLKKRGGGSEWSIRHESVKVCMIFHPWVNEEGKSSDPRKREDDDNLISLSKRLEAYWLTSRDITAVDGLPLPLLEKKLPLGLTATTCARRRTSWDH